MLFPWFQIPFLEWPARYLVRESLNAAVLVMITPEMQEKLGEGLWKQSLKWRFFCPDLLGVVRLRGRGKQLRERQNREPRVYQF